MICPLDSGMRKLRVQIPKPYSAAEVERMMKLQDVLLKAMAKKITWCRQPKLSG
jgi:hypothetical protein